VAASSGRPRRSASPDGRAAAVARPPALTLAALLLATCAALRPATADAQATPRPFAVERLAEGVYAIPGDTGRGSEGRPNAGFVVTDSGVLVVDALGSPEEGERLLRTVAATTPQPVRWLVLTHHHPDHHFGAIALRRAGARVLAHPERATLAAENGDSAFVAAWTEVVGARAMRGFAFADRPDVPVTGDTTLRIGGREVVLLQPGPAHTPGDLLVWLPAERVLFAGDLLIEDGVTIVVDGDSRVLLAALDRIDSLGARAVVVGHGRIERDPAALVARTRCYVHRLRATVGRAVAEGESMNRVLARMPPADVSRPVSRASRERRNAVRVYLEVERELMQLDDAAAGVRAPAEPRCPDDPAE
jgi:glyoxylase-like metal-dependent hydrolase (beta-lactamase superfamily II)